MNANVKAADKVSIIAMACGMATLAGCAVAYKAVDKGNWKVTGPAGQVVFYGYTAVMLLTGLSLGLRTTIVE